MEIIRRTLKAYMISICIFVIFTFLLAAVIYFTSFKESWAFAGLVIILSITSAIIGVMEANIFGKKGIFVGTAAAVVFLTLIFLVVAGIFAGTLTMDGFNIVYIIPILAGSVGGVFGANLNK